MNAPCYKCQQREIGCHDGCERYSQYKAKNDALREKWHMERIADSIKIDAEMRVLKKRHMKGRNR